MLCVTQDLITHYWVNSSLMLTCKWAFELLGPKFRNTPWDFEGDLKDKVVFWNTLSGNKYTLETGTEYNPLLYLNGDDITFKFGVCKYEYFMSKLSFTYIMGGIERASSGQGTFRVFNEAFTKRVWKGPECKALITPHFAVPKLSLVLPHLKVFGQRLLELTHDQLDTINDLCYEMSLKCRCKGHCCIRCNHLAIKTYFSDYENKELSSGELIDYLHSSDINVCLKGQLTYILFKEDIESWYFQNTKVCNEYLIVKGLKDLTGPPRLMLVDKDWVPSNSK